MFKDRDSGKFNLPAEETKRRRSIMWEVYTQDMWQVNNYSDLPHGRLSLYYQSFLYGRPPAFSLPYIDTQMPHETTLGPGGELEMNCKSKETENVNLTANTLRSPRMETSLLRTSSLGDTATISQFAAAKL
jgi:hypothetical protein